MSKISNYSYDITVATKLIHHSFIYSQLNKQVSIQLILLTHSLLELGESRKIAHNCWFVIKYPFLVTTIYFCGEALSKSRPASRTNQLTLIEVFPKIKSKYKLLWTIIPWTQKPDDVSFWHGGFYHICQMMSFLFILSWLYLSLLLPSAYYRMNEQPPSKPLLVKPTMCFSFSEKNSRDIIILSFCYQSSLVDFFNPWWWQTFRVYICQAWINQKCMRHAGWWASTAKGHLKVVLNLAFWSTASNIYINVL